MIALSKSLSLAACLALLLGSSTIPGAQAGLFGTRKSLLTPTHQKSPSINFDDGTKHLSPSAVAISALPRGGEVPALTGGMVVLAMAVTPYVLALFLKFIRPALLVYKTDTSDERLEAYHAQGYWTWMYASLGLALTLFQFFEVYFLGKLSAEDVLKDSFFVWAIFYTAAIVKIQIEDNEMILDQNRYVIINAFHLIFALSMWGAIYANPFFVKAINWLVNVFSGGKISEAAA